MPYGAGNSITRRSAGHPPLDRYVRRKRFVGEQLLRAKGERVPVRAVIGRYRTWCAQEKLAALDLNGSVGEFARSGTSVGNLCEDKLAYCVDLKLAEPNVVVFAQAFRAKDVDAGPAPVEI